MDTELLKTFLEVNKTRHFGRAADNLYLTPAAVSARVKLLEQQLGVAVFARHRGNIQLTSEGERLVVHAESILTSWDRAVQEVRLNPDQESRLHIGATSGLWMLTLQNTLLDLIESRPGLALHAEGHDADGLMQRVLSNNLDLVLVYDVPVGQGLQAIKVGTLELVLATNQSQDENFDLEQGYIYVDWGSAFGVFHARVHGDRLQSGLHVNLASIAISCLAVREGAAYLPSSTVAATSNLKAVKGVSKFRRPVYACFQESNPRQPLIKEIVETLNGLQI